MKKNSFIILAIFCLCNLYAKPHFGQSILFNDNWRFILADVKDAEKERFDDSKWKSIQLPNDWTIKGIYSPDKASCTGYLSGGIGWYRKTFNIPQSEKSNKIFIYFEGVYNRSEVFINGISVGKRPNGYISFMYDLSPYIKFGAENTLAVRVDHSKDKDSRWYSGSGIYRDVFLIYANPIHIDLWGVYFKSTIVDNNKAVVTIETTLKNEFKTKAQIQVLNEIIDPQTKRIVSTKNQNKKIGEEYQENVSQRLVINDPKIWSLENPNLYIVRTTIKQNGKVIDQDEQFLGVRSLTFDSDKGFALNNVWTKVKGVCIHHDAGVLGSAVPREVWKRRLINLKAMGCNAVRLSHNPQASDIYDLCDEIGILVMDEAFDEWEFPKRKWIEGWNIGTPVFQGSADFFSEWSEKDLADMVTRDRNHASVVMWSIGNEVDYPNDPYSHPVLAGSKINQPVSGGYMPERPKAEELGVIAKRLAAIVRSKDTSRPVTAALAGVVMSNETEYPFVLDLTGYNYTEDRYALDHAKYPKRIIYGSENGHSMEAWKAVRDNDYIFGQFIWTGIDYLGESGKWPSRGFYSGFLDFGGFQKPRGHFREALWSVKPVTYIGTYPVPSDTNYLSMDSWPIWNYTSNDIIRVVCYTNAPLSKLLLNGKQIGDSKLLNDKTGIIYWDIPFEKGKLEVIGFDAGNTELCRYCIETSERPYALKANSDVNVIQKERGLAQIIVQIVDEKGIPVILSDNEVTCTIDGPGELLGLEASNNSDMGNYADNVQRVFNGRLIAYVRATGVDGHVKVKFSSPWLKDADITIESF